MINLMVGPTPTEVKFEDIKYKVRNKDFHLERRGCSIDSGSYGFHSFNSAIL